MQCNLSFESIFVFLFLYTRQQRVPKPDSSIKGAVEHFCFTRKVILHFDLSRASKFPYSGDCFEIFPICTEGVYYFYQISFAPERQVLNLVFTL